MTGLADYWRMFRTRGPGRVWHHFFDVTLFDLRHGTDTDTWLPIRAYADAPQNIRSAVRYQPSFTSEIRAMLDFVAKRLGPDIRHYDFFDLGSGKGKVCFLARDYGFAGNHGIEFYAPLCKIAQDNADRIGGRKPVFHCVDVTEYAFRSDCLVFFAYNPFGRDIWEKLLRNLAGKKFVVIYNNPVHADLSADYFVWLSKTDSKWENKRNLVFASFPDPKRN
jgi:SAM-dependent methyltransferase